MFEYFRRDLVFKSPAGTSRGVLLNKPSWFLQSFQKGELQAVSECSIIPGLSIDEIDRINSSLDRLVHGKWSVSEILEDSSMIEKIRTREGRQ